MKAVAFRVALTLGVALWAATMPRSAGSEPSSSSIISKFDLDAYQTLDLAPVKAAASAHVGKLQKDKDGTLDAPEVEGIIGPKTFMKADADHDGTLSKDEYPLLVEKLFKFTEKAHRRVTARCTSINHA